MGQMTSIEINFHNPEAAEKAVLIARDMIKLYYLDGTSTLEPMRAAYETFVRERERIRAYSDDELNQEHPYNALQYLSVYGTAVSIYRCADLQRYLSRVGLERYSGFFYHLCLAVARELPEEPFEACSRFIMTVTDHVEKTRAYYDTKTLCFTQISGFMPFEDDYDDYRYKPDKAEWMLLPRCIAVNGKPAGQE